MTNNDLSSVNPDQKANIYRQSYDKKTMIDGVKILEIPNFVGDDSDFSELLKLGESGETEKFPGFHLRQINRTKLLPNATKAWHMHFNQDEIWYALPSQQILVGLWDLRKNSPTTGVSMRFNIGCGKSQLVFIPRGIAHGSANFTGNVVEMLYFVNNQFDITDPDEYRLHWDALGKEFWLPERD